MKILLFINSMQLKAITATHCNSCLVCLVGGGKIQFTCHLTSFCVINNNINFLNLSYKKWWSRKNKIYLYIWQGVSTNDVFPSHMKSLLLRNAFSCQIYFTITREFFRLKCHNRNSFGQCSMIISGILFDILYFLCRLLTFLFYL